MHKFLIQSERGIPLHDFGFQMIEACKYKNWFNDSNDYQYLLTDNFTFVTKASEEVSNFIPIGSVEFVHKFLEGLHNIKNVKPINIPKELFDYEHLKRCCYIRNKKGMGFLGNRFIKSMDNIKSFTEIINDRDIDTIPDGEYLVSHLINIDSEWRAFVYNNELVGLQNYSGDFMMWPNTDSILRMIHLYNDCPPAYTLDIGVNREVGTFLIEVHNFYSCGLYGFADNRILPNMFEKSFKWILEKYKEQK